MGRKTFRKELWTELNRPMSKKKNAPWWVPKVPSILKMAVRCFALFTINLGLWALEIVLILGEDVFWKFNFVDQMYTNAATNQFDVATFVVVVTWFLIWGIGAFYVVGFFDRWFQ